MHGRGASESLACGLRLGPKANSIAERLVASIRRECLDHVVVINERPHRTLCLDSP